MKLLSVIFLACATSVMAEIGPWHRCNTYPDSDKCTPGYFCATTAGGVWGSCIPKEDEDH
ncbi:uncharacterized protein BDW47DRAFT_105107 [Aspergillus candidus]|uniref:CBM1 domain-containing protein n=1 Tax=Aspergillus candidus TaxID=41067 RepID=A0A2I2FCB6_ASPCN|nr:hypothetical protein BDW47DRAFT_105107 [Aspergillus candidus]PLB38270.1 hypothetical protein BDW47DRAFT_105107 [Aspergillus candidus]